MHDMKMVRELGRGFDEALSLRGHEGEVSEELIAIDEERLLYLRERELLLEERNRLSKEVGLALPLIVLYEVSILVGGWVEKVRAKRNREEESG